MQKSYIKRLLKQLDEQLFVYSPTNILAKKPQLSWTLKTIRLKRISPSDVYINTLDSICQKLYIVGTVYVASMTVYVLICVLTTPVLPWVWSLDRSNCCYVDWIADDRCTYTRALCKTREPSSINILWCLQPVLSFYDTSCCFRTSPQYLHKSCQYSFSPAYAISSPFWLIWVCDLHLHIWLSRPQQFVWPCVAFFNVLQVLPIC